MKKILLVLLIGVIFTSCVESESPAFGVSDHPFIVGEIKQINEKVCLYKALSFNKIRTEGLIVSSFYAKPRMFQIGDTIKVCK